MSCDASLVMDTIVGILPATSDDAREESTGQMRMDVDIESTSSLTAPEGEVVALDEHHHCGARSEALSLDLIVDLVVSHLFSPLDLLSASQTCSRFRSAVRRVEARRTVLRGSC